MKIWPDPRGRLPSAPNRGYLLGQQNVDFVDLSGGMGITARLIIDIGLLIWKTFRLIPRLVKYTKAPTVGKKAENKAVGVSKGGRNTKIHKTLNDALNRLRDIRKKFPHHR